MNYSSVDGAIDNLFNVILNPDEYMDSKEKISQAKFELQLLYQKELEIFLKALKNKTNIELLQNNTCIWQKNDRKNILNITAKNCEVSTCIIPDNLRFEINKEYFKVTDLNDINKKQNLKKKLIYSN